MTGVMLVAALPSFLMMFAVEETERIPTYSVMGVTLAVLLYLMRRWAKQRDDALSAAQEAEKRERARGALEIEQVERRHESEMLLIKTELARMRSVMSRVLEAIMDESMTHDEKVRLRIDAMRVLFPSSQDRGDG